MTALKKPGSKPKKSAVEKPVYPPRPVENPDFEKLRKDAMRRFPKTRAYLGK